MQWRVSSYSTKSRILTIEPEVPRRGSSSESFRLPILDYFGFSAMLALCLRIL